MATPNPGCQAPSRAAAQDPECAIPVPTYKSHITQHVNTNRPSFVNWPRRSLTNGTWRTVGCTVRWTKRRTRPPALRPAPWGRRRHERRIDDAARGWSVRPAGIEPAACGLKDRCSLAPRREPLTTELRARAAHLWACRYVRRPKSKHDWAAPASRDRSRARGSAAAQPAPDRSLRTGCRARRPPRARPHARPAR